jgi:hypothetical protein
VSGLSLFRRGESGGAVARSVAASRPTPPDYPLAVLMAFQIYAGLSLVGGPDARYATCQFIPFDPFLAVACYRECYVSHEGI